MPGPVLAISHTPHLTLQKTIGVSHDPHFTDKETRESEEFTSLPTKII